MTQTGPVYRLAVSTHLNSPLFNECRCPKSLDTLNCFLLFIVRGCRHEATTDQDLCKIDLELTQFEIESGGHSVTKKFLAVWQVILIGHMLFMENQLFPAERP